MREKRKQESVDSALSALTEAARSGEGNLLDLSIKAARVRCSVGEITQAMEAVHKRHVASTNMVRGAYVSEHGETEGIKKTLELVKVLWEG
jgi:methylmalonyl-CoA mutase